MSPEERLDLEFEVEVDDHCTDADLVMRLRDAARRHQFMDRPVLDVQAGDVHDIESPYSTGSGGQAMFHADAADAADDAHEAYQAYHAFMAEQQTDAASARTPGGGWAAVRGRQGPSMAHLNHPTTPVGPDDSYWMHRKESRIRERRYKENREKGVEKESPAPFRARPCPPSVTAPLYQAMKAAADAGRHAIRDVARPETSPGTGGGEYEAGGGAMRRSRSADIRASDDEAAPFRARPVPWKVSAPLYDQLLIHQHEARRHRIEARSRELMRSSSLPPRLEAVRARLMGDGGRGGVAGGLPPGAHGTGRVYRSTTPVPMQHMARHSPQTRVVNRPLRSEHPCGMPEHHTAGMFAPAAPTLDAAEQMARGAAGPPGGYPGGARSSSAGAMGRGHPGGGYGGGDIGGGGGLGGVGHGLGLNSANYGVSHVDSRRTPRQNGKKEPDLGALGQPFCHTEVPDFKTLHEREQQRLERRKYHNRHVTQPEPFPFSTDVRNSLRMSKWTAAKAKHAATDPTEDYRFHQKRGRPASAPGGRQVRGPPLNERPPGVVVPPKSTVKTLQAQAQVKQHLEERRLRQMQEKFEEQQKHEPPFEMKMRIKKAVGEVEPQAQKIERLVQDKQDTRRRTVYEKKKALQGIKDRVSRRPLLMEQVDSQSRARRRALFRVHDKLAAAGLDPADGFFNDDELDVMGREDFFA